MPRKTIARDALAALNNDDIDEDILEKPRSSENSPASLKRNINIRSGQPDLHGVITLPGVNILQCKKLEIIPKSKEIFQNLHRSKYRFLLNLLVYENY